MAEGSVTEAILAVFTAFFNVVRFFLGLQFLRKPPRPSQTPQPPIDNGKSHPIAVVIPSWKEPASSLCDTISHLYATSALTAAFDEPAVIVAQAEGSDSSAALAALQSMHPKLRIVTFSTPSRGGQQNFGAQQATEPVLLFLHADTLLPAGWDATILSVLGEEARPTIGTFTLALPPPLTIGLRVMLFGANIRARYGNLPYGDQAYFLRKSTFEAVGGFPKVPIMEDIGLLKRIRAASGRVHVHEDSVLTSPRRWIQNGVVYNTVLNQCLVLAWTLGASPETIYKWYYGRPAKQ